MTVEKIYPLSFPNFDKVLLMDDYKIRRSKLYYIRTKVGKDARFKSIIEHGKKWADLLDLIKQDEVEMKGDIKIEEKKEVVETKEDVKVEEKIEEPKIEEKKGEAKEEWNTTDTAVEEKNKE